MTTGKSRRVREFYKKEKLSTERVSRRNGLYVYLA
jgi:hypothetical protein